MSLDAQLWEGLEAHGVTQAHMAMLLQALQVQKNGSLAWHFVHGTLTQCDLRLVFPSRAYDVASVSDVLLDGNRVLR